jgi:hypothetical protein
MSTDPTARWCCHGCSYRIEKPHQLIEIDGKKMHNNKSCIALSKMWSENTETTDPVLLDSAAAA